MLVVLLVQDPWLKKREASSIQLIQLSGFLYHAQAKDRAFFFQLIQLTQLFSIFTGLRKKENRTSYPTVLPMVSAVTHSTFRKPHETGKMKQKLPRKTPVTKQQHISMDQTKLNHPMLIYNGMKLCKKHSEGTDPRHLSRCEQ